MYGVDGGGTRASGPTCTRRAFQVRPHSTAASKQLKPFLLVTKYGPEAAVQQRKLRKKWFM